MTTPNGYNNLAYCHQYDSSMCEYQYVPEIDPDSPDLDDESNRKRAKLIQPKIQDVFPDSDEFEPSDESNRSIIIEERNNRRVTLICDKRKDADIENNEFYDNHREAYYQDISLESENAYDGRNTNEDRREERSLRHQRPLDPPIDQIRNNYSLKNYSNNIATISQQYQPTNTYQRSHRQHRYEEIIFDQECHEKPFQRSTSKHRYAEISTDENGYPTLKKEIEIDTRNEARPYNIPPTTFKVIPKPRAISPINYTKSYSQPSTPSRAYQRNPYSKDFNFSPSQGSSTSPSHIFYSSSPVRTDSFEMAELSPPRSTNTPHRSNEQTYFMNSPQRQPPIGASPINDLQEPFSTNGRCILPSHLQKGSKIINRLSHSVPNSPKRRIESDNICSPPSKPPIDKKVMQIFHIKPAKPISTKSKAIFRNNTEEKENNSARRNISNSFTDPPNIDAWKRKHCVRSESLSRSPHQTTTEVIQPKTAVITPIFQRKNYQDDQMLQSPKINFQKISHSFKSTGNIFKNAREQSQPKEMDFQANVPLDSTAMSPSRIKRNKSVPNFSQTFGAEHGRKPSDYFSGEIPRYSRNLGLQYSPKKQPEPISPVNKSRLSLIDRSKSWTTLGSDYRSSCSTCFIFATIVHLVTATTTCAISLYLLSKVGRKYYLDFGILAGFVNFILGLLGFRSYCWRWLPNRNYVSGFIGLAAFSAFTCAGLSYLIIVKPMAGDPILDIMGGAICAVSVLTIVLALTGLTMSGCCKSPPPDNRVNDV